MKRQLDSKYEDLVNWVNGKKQRLALRRIFNFILCPPRNLDEILCSLYSEDWQDDKNLDDVISSVVDIYNGNYEIVESKYFWRLNMPFMDFEITAYVGRCGSEYSLVTPRDNYGADRLTKSELIEALSNSNTNLTIDNFTPVEAI